MTRTRNAASSLVMWDLKEKPRSADTICFLTTRGQINTSLGTFRLNSLIHWLLSKSSTPLNLSSVRDSLMLNSTF